MQHEGVLDVWTNMVITVGAGSRYVVKQVTGTATLTKRGEGTLVFEGSGSSRKAGETIVAEGTIEFGEHQSFQLGNRVTIGGEGKAAAVILTSTRAYATDIFHWTAPGTFTVKDQGILDFTRNTHAVEIRAISAIRVEKGGRFERGSWTLNANAKVSYEEPPAPVIGTAGAAPALVTAAGGGIVFRVPVANAQAGCVYAVYVTEDLTQPFRPSGISVQAKSDGRLDLDIPTEGKASLFIEVRASAEP